jgi:hypothetical protein
LEGNEHGSGNRKGHGGIEDHSAFEQGEEHEPSLDQAIVVTAEEASPSPKTAEGRSLTRKVEIEPYRGPVGGWGSIKSVASIIFRQKVPREGDLALLKQNKPDGFMCVSCAWAKPRDTHPFEFCENGAKATAWELTSKRIGREFFAEHTCTGLESWSDFDFENAGRLTCKSMDLIGRTSLIGGGLSD